MTFKPHHIAFTVNNFEESIKWYQDHLGFQVISKHEKERYKVALIQLDDLRIELLNFLENQKSLPSYRKDIMNDIQVVGTKHLCIEVENLEETIKVLKDKRVEFVTEVYKASFGGRSIFFKDCNEILIELYQK